MLKKNPLKYTVFRRIVCNGLVSTASVFAKRLMANKFQNKYVASNLCRNTNQTCYYHEVSVGCDAGWNYGICVPLPGKTRFYTALTALMP